MGRNAHISRKIAENKYISTVKCFVNGGGYIPIPKKYKGKIVKILILDKKKVKVRKRKSKKQLCNTCNKTNIFDL